MVVKANLVTELLQWIVVQNVMVLRLKNLGFYNPMTDETHLKFERIKARLKDGAQPTETVHNIFVKAKIFD